MTLVYSMIFDSKHSAMMSDERTLRGDEKVYYGPKLEYVKKESGIYVLGGVGNNGNLLCEHSHLFFQGDFNEGLEKTQERAERLLRDLYKKRITDYHEESVDLALNLHLPIFSRKKTKIRLKVLQDLAELNNRREDDISSAILLLSRVNGISKIWASTYDLSCEIPIYAVIGSGDNYAEMIIKKYLKDIEPSQRSNIGPKKGLRIMTEGLVKAGENTINVDDNPHYIAIKEDEIFEPRKKESRLAIEIAKARLKGLIPEAFEEDAIYQIVYHNADFDSINAELFRQSRGNEKELELLLRGY